MLLRVLTRSPKRLLEKVLQDQHFQWAHFKSWNMYNVNKSLILLSNHYLGTHVWLRRSSRGRGWLGGGLRCSWSRVRDRWGSGWRRPRHDMHRLSVDIFNIYRNQFRNLYNRFISPFKESIFLGCFFTNRISEASARFEELFQRKSGAVCRKECPSKLKYYH